MISSLGGAPAVEAAPVVRDRRVQAFVSLGNEPWRGRPDGPTIRTTEGA
jgi:hypothetical protein